MAGLNETQLRNLKRNSRVMYKMLSAPCVDCNIVWHPLVMTFDHEDRATKKYVIADLKIAHPATFDREIAKCAVVCRNCHQIREYLRDINVMDIGEAKRGRYRYYERLVPYLCGGAMLRRDAFKFVRIGNI